MFLNGATKKQDLSLQLLKPTNKHSSDRIFTEGSYRALRRESAVKFAQEHNSILQSMKEAAQYRIHSNFGNGSHLYQSVRTSAIYFQSDRQLYVAFEDNEQPQHNLITTYASKGEELLKARQYLQLQLTEINPYIKQAEKTGRIIQVEKHSEEIAIDEMKDHEGLTALFQEINVPYQKFLQQQGIRTVRFVLYSAEHVSRILKANHATIVPCGLGERQYKKTDIHATTSFASTGRARGTRDP